MSKFLFISFLLFSPNSFAETSLIDQAIEAFPSEQVAEETCKEVGCVKYMYQYTDLAAQRALDGLAENCTNIKNQYFSIATINIGIALQFVERVFASPVPNVRRLAETSGRKLRILERKISAEQETSKQSKNFIVCD